VNEHLARINGLPADQHVGLMTRDVNPDAARAVELYLRRVFSRGESILNVEIQGTTQAQSGALRTWLASFHPLRGASGVIIAISVVVLEITERKHSEQALALSEARNRQLVDNSSYGIFRISPDGTFERQLHQSQKFEAIGQLAGGIAHDFNNVVGAILGWAELGFEQSRSYPQISERFARIREQAERAAALTRELLAFARRQILQPRNVDLNAITGDLAGFLDKVIRKDIELKVINAPLDALKADPTQIEQVLMNLCLNARDAMPRGADS
jgi:signal transduction histidine kinase